MVGSLRFFSVFIAIISLGMCSSSFAQTSRLLIAWDLPVSSTSASVASGFNDPAVLANNITLGGGLTASSNSGGWGATSWTLGGADPFANGTVNNDYIAFRVTASASDRVTITGVSRLAIQVSASGPKYWHVLYSSVNTDGAFTTPERNFGPFEVTILEQQTPNLSPVLQTRHFDTHHIYLWCDSQKPLFNKWSPEGSSRRPLSKLSGTVLSM
jgi:hypothetical protein